MVTCRVSPAPDDISQAVAFAVTIVRSDAKSEVA
jgi:hypothetical protein